MEESKSIFSKFENLFNEFENINKEIDQNESVKINLFNILEELNTAIQTCCFKLQDYISIVDHCILLKPSSEEFGTRICNILLSLYDLRDFRNLSICSEDIILFIDNYILRFTTSESFIYTALKIINLALTNDKRRSEKVCDSLCCNPGLVIKLIEKKMSKSCTLEGVRVLQLLSYRSSEDSNVLLQERKEVMSAQVISNSQKTALNCLKDLSVLENTSKVDNSICVACLSIIYNLLSYFPSEVLTGLIVNVCQPYIFYKLKNIQKALFTEYEVPNMSDFLDDEDETKQKQANGPKRNKKRRFRHMKKKSPMSLIPADVKNSSNTTISSNRIANIFSNRSTSQKVSLMPEWITKKQNEPVIENQSVSLMPEWMTKKEIEPLLEKQSVTGLVWNQPIKEHVSSCSNSKYEPFARNFEASLPQSDSFSEASVRQCALYVMKTVIEITGKQNKFIFWPQLMCQEPSIMTCILKDPDLTVRMAALTVVVRFLMYSNSVLSLSTDCDTVGSFTTLSKQLGTSVRALHHCLARALLSEKMADVLVRILKAIELLFENVNCARLKPGLLSKVVVHVKYFLKYKDCMVRANAFSTMVSFLKIKPKTAEMESILSRYQIPLTLVVKNTMSSQQLSPTEEWCPGEESEELFQNTSSEDRFSSDSSTNHETHTTTILWILQRCIESLLYDENSGMLLQVKMQSINVLNSLVSEHFHLIQSSLPVVQNLINDYCNSSNSRHQDHDESLIERVYVLLGHVLNTIKGQEKDSSNTSPKEGIHLSQEESLQLWLWALQNPLAHVLSYPDQYRKSNQNVEAISELVPKENICSAKIFLAGATVLGNISAYVLQEIGEEYLNKFFQTVMFLIAHSDIDFQSCGIRIVGVTVEFPTFHDSLLGSQIVRVAVSSSCEMLSSEEHNVKKSRLLSAWVLANISTFLQQCRITWEASNNATFLTKCMITKFFTAAILGCNDKDTISPPAIRSLGNLISYLPPELISDRETRTFVDDVVKLLIKSCLTAHLKSRWNACHALATILKCAKISFESADWMASLITSLSGLVENFKNFKVRILACSALCNISQRIYFVDVYLTVWKALLNGVDNVGNICGMQEVHHRHDLTWQLCYGICHLITLLEFTDLEHIREKLEVSHEILEATMVQADRLMPPEKTSCFLKAIEHVNNLLDSDVICTSEEKTLKLILSIIKV